MDWDKLSRPKFWLYVYCFFYFSSTLLKNSTLVEDSCLDGRRLIDTGEKDQCGINFFLLLFKPRTTSEFMISIEMYKSPEGFYLCLSACLLGWGWGYSWVYACISRWSRGGRFWLLRMIWISPGLSGSLSFKHRYFTSVSCSQSLTKKYNTKRVQILDACLVL